MTKTTKEKITMENTETMKEEQTCMTTPPQAEHRWLQQLVGQWTYEGDCDMGPDKPREKSKGTESVRAIGELWILGEGQCTMPDGEPGTTLLTLGFDPEKKRYVGTWVGSMMSKLWVYDGELDKAGKVLTLNAEGPSFTDSNKLAMYQDVVEIKSADHRVWSSRIQREDGSWHTFLTAEYRRKKSTH